jgi:hypothetical protein
MANVAEAPDEMVPFVAVFAHRRWRIDRSLRPRMALRISRESTTTFESPNAMTLIARPTLIGTGGVIRSGSRPIPEFPIPAGSGWQSSGLLKLLLGFVRPAFAHQDLRKASMGFGALGIDPQGRP